MSRHGHVLSARQKTIKRDFDRLVEAVGGPKRAEGCCRVGRKTIDSYCNPNTLDFPPFDVVLDLEEVALRVDGFPQMTRLAAANCGHLLIEMPAVSGLSLGDIHAQLSAHAIAAAKVIKGICEALADDNRVSAEEVERLELIQALDEAMTVLAAMRAELTRIAEAG